MSKIFCGHLGVGPFSLLGRRGEPDATTWFPPERVHYLHRGRTAIRCACGLLGLGPGSEVLVPAYNCGTEVDALANCGASVVLYQVQRSGDIDLDDLQRRITGKTKAVYVTHYFGFPQPMADIKRLCQGRGIYLVEDCALSLFSCDGTTRLGSVGEMSVFSFPKSLPVPDGGALQINSTGLASDDWDISGPSFRTIARASLSLLKRQVLRCASDKRIAYPLLWSLLQRRQSHPGGMQDLDGVLRPDIPRSFYYDEKLDDRGISRLTRRLLKTFDIAAIVAKRRENFTLFQNMLSGTSGVEPVFKRLPDGVCPLYFPVIVGDRASLCRKLNDLSIGAVEWWAGYHRSLHWDEYKSACFLKDHVLALPVHQQLNPEHIKYIAENVSAFAS